MKNHFWKTVVLVSVAALITAGCSGIPRRAGGQEALERYQKYAGAPVDHITYVGSYSGWAAIDRYHILLWTGVSDAYLLSVNSPCEDLWFADRIALTQTANTLYTKFDSVLVKGWRCPIAEIRPIDYRKMQQDLREERAQQKAENAQQSKTGRTAQARTERIVG